MSTKNILVSDIGGTNSRFALFKFNENNPLSLQLVESEWIETKSVQSIKALLEKLSDTKLRDHLENITYVVLAAAGPIIDDSFCDPPNISWKIYIADIESFFPQSKVFLINDFLAQAYACVSPVSKQSKCIKKGKQIRGTTAVMGAGTGLGKAILYEDRKISQIHGIPSEGGHANYSPETEQEFYFSQFLKSEMSARYITWEMVLSGTGLRKTMKFFSGEDFHPKKISLMLSKGKYPEVIRMYVGNLARACRCFALETFCTGGLFIAGGILAKNQYLLEHQDFIATFELSSTQATFLKNVPIYLMESEESGLWGAAEYAVQKDTYS